MNYISGSKNCKFCGSNHKAKCFFVYDDGFHCFSCGKSKRAERNFVTKSIKVADGIELPELTRNPRMFSLEASRYLAQYHVTDDLVYKYSIAEAIDGSLITPVIVGGEVVMYQRRWFNPRRITTSGAKRPFIAGTTNSNTLVVVEDFISSIRVGEIYNCYCMFGTSIPHDVIKQLVKEYDIIIIWADGDGPGQKAASKLLSVFKTAIAYDTKKRAFAYQFNKIVRNVLTSMDPKCYTNTTLRAILSDQGVSSGFDKENSK